MRWNPKLILLASILGACVFHAGQPCLGQGTKEMATLAGHSGVITFVAFSPDGKTLATASWDKSIKLWDVAKGKELLSLKGHSHEVWCVAFAPDGKTLASSSADGKVKLWEVATGTEVRTLQEQAPCIAFLPDGKTLAATGNPEKKINLWDLDAGKVRASLNGAHWGNGGLAVAPDGKTIVTGADMTVKLWDIATKKRISTIRGFGSLVLCVAFSSDGKLVASGDGEDKVKIWDVATGKERSALEGHVGHVYSVAFAPGGKVMAWGWLYNRVQLWDVARGRRLRTLTGHTEAIHCLAFSPEGKSLATGSSDRTVKLWDVSAATEAAK
jgi:WD40 repeat protein